MLVVNNGQRATESNCQPCGWNTFPRYLASKATTLYKNMLDYNLARHFNHYYKKLNLSLKTLKFKYYSLSAVA